MAEVIPDRVIVGILRPFVRATRPVLDALRESDPFGLRSRAARKGAEPADEHVTTLIAAVPGLGGALANRLPVSKAVGAAGQGLLLVAIAGEHGMRDEDELVNLLGALLFRRELAVSEATRAEDEAAEARAAELTGDLAEPDSRPTLARVGKAVWRLGRALFAVEDELDKRPHGNFLHEGLGMLPVVGAVGKYLGEWSGLKKTAREAEKRLASYSPGGTR
jgi:hypothetical protein